YQAPCPHPAGLDRRDRRHCDGGGWPQGDFRGDCEGRERYHQLRLPCSLRGRQGKDDGAPESESGEIAICIEVTSCPSANRTAKKQFRPIAISASRAPT